MMDLVAGDTRAILLAIALDDRAALADRDRFVAHLALGAGLDPAWLDLFAKAARAVVSDAGPGRFVAACSAVDGPGGAPGRVVARVDRAWLAAVARIPDARVDAVAARWIDLLDAEYDELVEPEEKTWIRRLAADLVAFARTALGAPDVLFARSGAR